KGSDSGEEIKYSEPILTPEQMEKIGNSTSSVASNIGVMVGQMAKDKVTEEAAKKFVDGALDVARKTTDLFVDKGMVGAAIGGGNIIIPEPPSNVAQVIRNGSKWAPPVVGGAIDMGIQLSQGEDVTDAGIKAVSHVAIGVATAKVAAMSCAPTGPLVSGFCGMAGFVAGWAASDYFDEWYDDEFKK
ncbi:hypothetical protein HYE66_01835, partial [Aggregatibacter actinomycetemcomitans]|nr:hypothetical protein [Aggregatibacter actinomycetemcomitans]